MKKNHSVLKCIIISLLLISCIQNTNKHKTVNITHHLTQDIESYIKKQEELGFKGVVYIAKNDSIIYKSNKDNNTSNEAYHIASISKQFTATAILKLYESNKISLNDTLGKFFESVPLNKRKITIHNLLTHTSGLPNNYVADGESDRQKAIESILSEPLEYEIGESYHYSAEGYNLLAIIIEIVTGITYEDFMMKNIFKPFGLNNISFWGKKNKQLSLAPYGNMEVVNELPEKVFNQGKSITNYGFKGSTGIYSTIDDLYKWTQLVKNNKLLSKQNTELLFKPYIKIRGDSINRTFYGYGWVIQLKNNRKIGIRHGGDEAGQHNGIIRWNNNGYTIIVLSNKWANNIVGKFKGVGWSTVLSIGLRDLLKK